MKTKKLQLTVAVILFTFVLVAPAKAGISGKSPYDLVVDIYVTTCDGDKTVFYDCVITNIGPYSVSFIANQGRIPTGNGKEIIVSKNTCTSVILVER